MLVLLRVLFSLALALALAAGLIAVFQAEARAEPLLLPFWRQMDLASYQVILLDVVYLAGPLALALALLFTWRRVTQISLYAFAGVLTAAFDATVFDPNWFSPFQMRLMAIGLAAGVFYWLICGKNIRRWRSYAG